MQIVSNGDNLHKCQIPFSDKNISKCHLLKFLPRVLSVNDADLIFLSSTLLYKRICCGNSSG